jgi:alpha-beta hydrolase superfamily lysophospholipase
MASMPSSSGQVGNSFQAALAAFEKLYMAQWADTQVHDEADGNLHALRISSQKYLRDHPGNYPKIMHHGQYQDDVVVLIHGITDSPYYMEAIGRRFHEKGFNVVLPLLPAHGLKEPWPSIQKLKYTDWIQDVDTVIDIARKLGRRVSLGGFSTGGALTIHKVIRNPADITGGLFLFSAALDIGDIGQFLFQSQAGPLFGRIIDDKIWFAAEVKEQIKMIKEARSATPAPREPHYGIGDNPCKYSVFFYEGAAELAAVIEKINDHYEKTERYSDIHHPIFVAHSREDESARFQGAERIINNHPNKKKCLFIIDNLSHSSVVLEKRITNDSNQPLEPPENPDFSKMIAKMLEFTEVWIVPH